MDLEAFVGETLKQIICGVKAAQQVAKTQGAWVNPKTIPGKGHTVLELEPGEAVQDIEFDVAVTVHEQRTKTGGAELAVVGIKVGGKGEGQSSTRSISHVKFTVPVFLPQQDWA